MGCECSQETRARVTKESKLELRELTDTLHRRAAAAATRPRCCGWSHAPCCCRCSGGLSYEDAGIKAAEVRALAAPRRAACAPLALWRSVCVCMRAFV